MGFQCQPISRNHVVGIARLKIGTSVARKQLKDVTLAVEQGACIIKEDMETA